MDLKEDEVWHLVGEMMRGLYTLQTGVGWLETWAGETARVRAFDMFAEAREQMWGEEAHFN